MADSYIWGPKVAALMIAMMRMVSVSTIDRRDTWQHTWRFYRASRKSPNYSDTSRHQPYLPQSVYVSIQ